MALIESLGYKESPRRSNFGDGLNTTGPFGSNMNTNRNKTRQFEYESKNNWNHQQINRNNNPDLSYDYSEQYSSTVFRSPKPKQNETKQDFHKNKNKNKNKHNKYASLPRKSMLASGLGAISPIPPKYNTSNLHNHHSSANINKLDITTNLSGNNQSHLSHLSPIKANKHNSNNNSAIFEHNPHLNTTQNINTTTTTLNLSNIPHSNINYPNDNRMSMIYKENMNINNEKQILIIGFPASEASFIHHKFRCYGNIINAKLNQNTLFLEYQSKENAVRGLAENAKWIKNGNLTYMISVIYAEIAQDNNQQSGRFLNLNESSQINQINRNQTRHFAQNYQNLERPPDLQSGPTHVLWKIFNFITTGW